MQLILLSVSVSQTVREKQGNELSYGLRSKGKCLFVYSYIFGKITWF